MDKHHMHLLKVLKQTHNELLWLASQMPEGSDKSYLIAITEDVIGAISETQRELLHVPA